MKKYYKLLAVFVAVVLVVCCCCFTASATTVSGISDAVVLESTGVVLYLPEVENFDGYWANCLYIPEPLAGKMYLRTKVNFTLNYANVFKWDSFRFSLWSDGTHPTVLNNLSFVLMDGNYNVLATLYEYDYSNASFYGVEHFDFPSGSFSTVSAIDVKYIALAFDFSTQSNTTLKYHLNNVIYNVSVIDSATAEQEKTNELLGDITADKYEPPKGGDVLDQQGQLEQEALDSTEQGRDEASKLFNDFDIGFFRDGFNAVVVLYNRIIPKWIWLDKLLVFSLTVGVFALLVGLAQSAIGPLSGYERKNWQKGAARQDAVRTKKDGIASHRPSRK